MDTFFVEDQAGRNTVSGCQYGLATIFKPAVALGASALQGPPVQPHQEY